MPPHNDAAATVLSVHQLEIFTTLPVILPPRWAGSLVTVGPTVKQPTAEGQG